MAFCLLLTQSVLYTALIPPNCFTSRNYIPALRSLRCDQEIAIQKRSEIGHAYHYTKATDWFPQVAVEKGRALCCAALQPGARKHRN